MLQGRVSMLFGDLTIQDVVEDILMWIPLRRGALDAVTHASSSLRQTSSCLQAYRSAFFVCKGGCHARAHHAMTHMVTLRCRIADEAAERLAKLRSPYHFTSIDLTQCALLTNAGVATLARLSGDKLRRLCLDRMQLHSDYESEDLVVARFLFRSSQSVKNASDLTDDALVAVANCCPNLEELSLSGMSQVTQSGLSVITTQCPHLKCVRVSLANGNLVLPIIFANCRELTHLRMVYFRMDDENLPAPAFHEVSTSLKSLKLGGFLLSEDALAALDERCPALTALELFGSGEGYAHLSSIAHRFPHLVRLCFCVKGHADDEATAAFVRSHPMLESLQLQEAPITDSALSAIAACCPSFTSLSIGGCKAVTSVGICHVAKACTLLEKLFVQECSLVSGDAVCEVARSCCRMKCLNLNGLLLADRDVVEIATLIGNRLEYLEIDGAAVGDTGLSAIAAHCPRLRHLSVASAKGVSDAGVAEVAKHCPQLQFLNVSKSPDLTTEGLVEVLSRCGNLHVRGCL